ncbi:MAG: hypothetical protein QXV97_00860 [Candidatus Caldarchaeum sp.]
MLGHLQKAEDNVVCRVCGREISGKDMSFYVTGFGNVCRTCGLQQVVCEGCGSNVKRMTVTVLRGRTLCLSCYRTEREKGEKRILKEKNAGSIQEALRLAADDTPDGFRLIGLRLKPSSTKTWVAEYEREDVFISRCS